MNTPIHFKTYEVKDFKEKVKIMSSASKKLGMTQFTPSYFSGPEMTTSRITSWSMTSLLLLSIIDSDALVRVTLF